MGLCVVPAEAIVVGACDATCPTAIAAAKKNRGSKILFRIAILDSC
jgi:hypothetical protein